MMGPALDRDVLARTGLLVGVSTLSLTAAFVGLVAVFSGGVTPVTNRMPFYVLLMATLFVVSIFTFVSRGMDGREVLTSTVGVAIGGFLLVSLGGEGLVYLATNPGQMFSSHLLVYLLAAGLICTGLAYWTLRFWREFVD